MNISVCVFGRFVAVGAVALVVGGCMTIGPSTAAVTEETGLAAVGPQDAVALDVKITKYTPAEPGADVEFHNPGRELLVMSAVGLRRVLNSVRLTDAKGTVLEFRIKRGSDVRIMESALETAAEIKPGDTLRFHHIWDPHLVLVEAETGREMGGPARLGEVAQGGAAWSLDAAIARPAGVTPPKNGPVGFRVKGAGKLW